jgi:hypothetical protein
MALPRSQAQEAKSTLVDTTSLAQSLYRASRTENGNSRDAWALARRLAGYIRRPRVGPLEELAFCRLEGGRIGVSRFRNTPRGKLKDFIMLSIEADGIPAPVRGRLLELAGAEFVVAGKSWQAQGESAGGPGRTSHCR